MQLARSVRARNHDISIVMLLETSEPDAVVASFRNGAKGVFSRTEPLSELRRCIECVSEGRIWAGSAEAEYLLDAVQSAPCCDGVVELGNLTRREIKVAELAAQGISNKRIAQQLNLSEHTVKNYLYRIFEKLNVSNRTELLFAMVNARDQILSKKIASQPAAAMGGKAGSGQPQFMLAMAHAHLEDNGVKKKDEPAAYRWFRMAEVHLLRLLQESRYGVEELRSRLQPQEIRQLEQQISDETKLDQASEVPQQAAC